MNPTGIRTVLAVLRRQWWIILQAVVVVGALTGWLAARTPANLYQATATFIVRPDTTTDTSVLITRDVGAFLLGQKRVLMSDQIAADVAKRLGAPSADALLATITVGVDPTASTISVTAYAKDPQTPINVANGFANSFIDNKANQRTNALRDRAAQLDAQVKKIDERITQYTADIAAATAADRDTSASVAAKEAAIRQYSSLADQQQQVLTELATQPNLAELIEPAKATFQPATPSAPKRGAVGAALGLLLGLAIAVVRELLDDRLRSAEDAASLTNSTVLVEVPRGHSRVAGLPVFEGTDGAMAEAVKSLRTTVQFLGIERPIQAVAVTSPEAGDGKSTVAANLAAAYALAGSRTVLISGDLRKPSLDPLFGASGELGFSDILFDRARLRHEAPHVQAPTSIDGYLVETAVPQLWLLPAGSPTRSPAELLSAGGLADLLTELRSKADMIVIDTTPTLVSDSVVLAKTVDGVLLVLSLNQSRKSRIRASVEALTNSRVELLGVVLNRSKSLGDSYGYYGAASAPRSARRRMPPAVGSASTPGARRP